MTATPACFCCTKRSRERDDRAVAKLVLPLAPRGEWRLQCNPDDLMATTGSRDIVSFFVLKDVFLFLELHTDTLLAVAGTCRSWRILSDNLPHWRYVLPMRSWRGAARRVGDALRPATRFPPPLLRRCRRRRASLHDRTVRRSVARQRLD